MSYLSCICKFWTIQLKKKHTFNTRVLHRPNIRPTLETKVKKDNHYVWMHTRLWPTILPMLTCNHNVERGGSQVAVKICCCVSHSGGSNWKRVARVVTWCHSNSFFSIVRCCRQCPRHFGSRWISVRVLAYIKRSTRENGILVVCEN